MNDLCKFVFNATILCHMLNKCIVYISQKITVQFTTELIWTYSDIFTFLFQVLSPFYIFQIFSCTLWYIDEYEYYASCIVFISVVSITATVYETRKVCIHKQELRTPKLIVLKPSYLRLKHLIVKLIHGQFKCINVNKII